MMLFKRNKNPSEDNIAHFWVLLKSTKEMISRFKELCLNWTEDVETGKNSSHLTLGEFLHKEASKKEGRNNFIFNPLLELNFSQTDTIDNHVSYYAEKIDDFFFKIFLNSKKKELIEEFEDIDNKKDELWESFLICKIEAHKIEQEVLKGKKNPRLLKLVEIIEEDRKKVLKVNHLKNLVEYVENLKVFLKDSIPGNVLKGQYAKVNREKLPKKRGTEELI